jgi:hypothetical protein
MGSLSCCPGCSNPSRDGVVLHSNSCNYRARATQLVAGAVSGSLYKPQRRHLAVIRLSQERIRALLEIPSNWQIVNVGFDQFRNGHVEILFSGDDLYPVSEGCEAPVITATYNLPDPARMRSEPPMPAPADRSRFDARGEYAEGNPT